VPLVRLGCADPVLSIAGNKKDDPARDTTSLVFRKWWHYHQDKPVRTAKLNFEVQKAMNLKEMSRQRVTFWLQSHAGVWMAGFRLQRIHKKPVWGVDVYSLRWVGEGEKPVFDADGDPIDSPPPRDSQKRRRST
jgi:hypothetical protein